MGIFFKSGWKKRWGKAIGKIAGVGVGVALGAVGAGALAGGAKKTGLFSKLGNIFKKKKKTSTTPLGGDLGGTLKSAASAMVKAGGDEVASDVGSTVRGLTNDLASKISGEAVKGAEEGLLKTLWAEHKGIIIPVGVVLIGGAIYLFTRKKGYRR